MRLSLIAVGIASVLFFTGCDDTQNAEKVALEMCELAKKGDVKGMKKHANPEFFDALNELDKAFQKVLDNKDAKKEFDKKLSLMSDINCKETTDITDISETRKKVVNSETSQIFFLELIDSEWKVSMQ